jgi:hypothetical protein
MHRLAAQPLERPWISLLLHGAFEMAPRKRNTTKLSSKRPALRIETLEQRYLLSANKGFAVSTISATADGDWACQVRTNEISRRVSNFAKDRATRMAADRVCENVVAANDIPSIATSNIQTGDEACVGAVVATDLAIEASDFAANEFVMMAADVPVETQGDMVADTPTVVARMPESDIPDGTILPVEDAMPPITEELWLVNCVNVTDAPVADDGSASSDGAVGDKECTPTDPDYADDPTVTLRDVASESSIVATEGESETSEAPSDRPVDEFIAIEQVEMPETGGNEIVEGDGPDIYTMSGETESSNTQQTPPLDEGAAEERPDTSNGGEEHPVIYTLDGEPGSSNSESDLTTVDTGEPSKDTPPNTDEEPPVIVTLGGDESEGDVTTTDDPGPTVTTVPLKQKDVKRLAKKLKRGEDVELDIQSLVQLHSRGSKRTQQMIERVIATSYAKCQMQLAVEGNPGISAVSSISYVQAIGEAYAAVGTPDRGLRINGSRIRVAP